MRDGYLMGTIQYKIDLSAILERLAKGPAPWRELCAIAGVEYIPVCNLYWWPRDMSPTEPLLDQLVDELEGRLVRRADDLSLIREEQP